MKKFLIILGFILSNLYAFDNITTIKVYNKIITSIFPKKETINIYVLNKKYIDLFEISTKIHVVSDIKKASIALVTNENELYKIRKLNKKIMIFATKEKLIFVDELIIGAFYWKKGRSQLLFIKDRLNKYHIKLPNEYDKFIIEL